MLKRFWLIIVVILSISGTIYFIMENTKKVNSPEEGEFIEDSVPKKEIKKTEGYDAFDRYILYGNDDRDELLWINRHRNDINYKWFLEWLDGKKEDTISNKSVFMGRKYESMPLSGGWKLGWFLYKLEKVKDNQIFTHSQNITETVKVPSLDVDFEIDICTLKLPFRTIENDIPIVTLKQKLTLEYSVKGKKIKRKFRIFASRYGPSWCL